MSNRALCATSTASPANSRNRRTASSTGGAPRSSRRRRSRSAPRSAAGSGTRGLTSVSNALRELEPRDPHRADLADPRACRARARSSRGRRRRRSPPRAAAPAPGGRRAPTRPAPGEPRIAVDDVVEQRPREPRRNVPEREERPRRVLDRHRPAPLLDELDEPVGGVERELHGLDPRRTYVRLQPRKRRAAPLGERLRPSSVSEERPGLPALDGRLQLAAGRELRHGRSRDVHLLARLRGLTPCARGAIAGRELAEPRERDRVTASSARR